MKRRHRRSSKKRGKKMAFIPRAFFLFRVRTRASPCTSVPFSTRSRRQRGRGKKENAERAGGTSAERVDVVLEESPLDGIKGDSASVKLPLACPPLPNVHFVAFPPSPPSLPPSSQGKRLLPL